MDAATAAGYAAMRQQYEAAGLGASGKGPGNDGGDGDGGSGGGGGPPPTQLQDLVPLKPPPPSPKIVAPAGLGQIQAPPDYASLGLGGYHITAPGSTFHIGPPGGLTDTGTTVGLTDEEKRAQGRGWNAMRQQYEAASMGAGGGNPIRDAAASATAEPDSLDDRDATAYLTRLLHDLIMSSVKGAGGLMLLGSAAGGVPPSVNAGQTAVQEQARQKIGEANQGLSSAILPLIVYELARRIAGGSEGWPFAQQ